MENKAHYALIGIFVFLSFILAILFVAWLSNAQFDQQFDDYEVTFVGPVRGISQGSEVRFNGLRVGEVTKLSLDPNDTSSVLVSIQVTGDTPVHTNSYAQLEPLGLTGQNYIQVFSGGEDFPLLRDFPGRGEHRIPGRMSQIDSFVEGGSTVIESAQFALNRVNAVLTEDAIADFHQILKNIEVLSFKLSETDIDTALINEVLSTFKTAADDVSNAALAVDATADETKVLVEVNAKEFLARTQKSLDEVDKTLSSFTGFAEGGRSLTVDASDAINRLSNSGFTDIEETTDALRQLMITLNRIADSIDQNPTGFIAGREKQEVELPQ